MPPVAQPGFISSCFAHPHMFTREDGSTVIYYKRRQGLKADAIGEAVRHTVRNTASIQCAVPSIERVPRRGNITRIQPVPTGGVVSSRVYLVLVGCGETQFEISELYHGV